MRRTFESAGLPLERFGWASVQLDGGIDKALGNVAAWFARARPPAVERQTAGLGALQVGLVSAAPVGPAGVAVFARVARALLAAGGTVLLAESDPLLAHAGFRQAVLGAIPPRATLAYGQPFTAPGLHLVATESDHWGENLAGLGGCGAHLFLGLVGDTPQQGHPMLALLQVADPDVLPASSIPDVDLLGPRPRVGWCRRPAPAGLWIFSSRADCSACRREEDRDGVPAQRLGPGCGLHPSCRFRSNRLRCGLEIATSTMTPPDPFLVREISLIQRIINDETWLEGERRGCRVEHHDVVVRENVCGVVLRVGQQLRDSIEAELKCA